VRRAAGPRGSDAGFTLIELLVYISLAGIVLSIVGGMLISSLRAEASVRTASEATTLGQLIARSVQGGMRNASAARLTTNADDTQMLIVRTAGRGASVTWSCQAWFYDPVNDGTLYTRTTTPAATIAVPTSGTIGSWTLLGDGIATSGTPVFDGIPTRISIDLDIEAGDRAPISITTTATTRTLATESQPCFA